MTSNKHHQGPGRLISKIGTQGLTLAVGSAITLTAVLLASVSLYAQTFQVIHNFDSAVDGSQPNGLTRDAGGNFYGTTTAGGAHLAGTVFKMDSTTHVVSVLHNFIFNSSDGALPEAGVTLDSADNLYGTTSGYGVFGRGTVFKLDPTGVETILLSFHKLNGDQPHSDMTRDPAGNLYGTTAYGGTQDNGVIFRIDTSGTDKTLYKFAGSD